MDAQLETLRSWARSDAASPSSVEGWAAALDLVATLPEARRRRGFLMPGYASLRERLRAVPSAVPQLLASWGLHCALAPRWPELVTAAEAARRVARGIFDRRFYAPLKDIALDLLNRRDRLSDVTALEDSQESLARMLSEYVQDVKGKGKGKGKGRGRGGRYCIYIIYNIARDSPRRPAGSPLRWS